MQSLSTSRNTFEYNLVRRKRRTLAIHIEPTGEVNVYAPFKCSEEYIQKIINEKTPWILRKLADISESSHLIKYNKIAHGEKALYLGKSYIIDIEENVGIKRPNLSILEDKLSIKIGEKDRDKTKEILKKWYIQKALENIEDRVKYFSKFFNRKPTLIKIKSAKRRWGSCNTRGVINFNWKCIFTPQSLIDYIVVHEMCHLIHMNHSKEFWRSVEAILPDYKERRILLKKFGVCLDF